MLAAPILAQSQTGFADLQSIAENALVTGDPEETVRVATVMLDQQPNSFAALYLLALGQAELGELQNATANGARAYNAAMTDAARFDAARFVAGTHFRAGQYTRSQIWLRRAANHTSQDADLAFIAEAYDRSAQLNPLSLYVSAFVAPSDNINNGSEDGILRLEGIGLTFVLPEDRRSLSGVAFSASTELRYRISETPDQSTYFVSSLSGETYALSQDAKDLLASSPNPDVRAVDGSDFSTVTAAVGITRQQNNISPFGPVQLRLDLGTYWEGGERLVNFVDLSAAQVFAIDNVSAFRLTLKNRNQTALTPTLLDTTTTDVIGAYDRFLANDDQLQITLSGRYADAGPESSFEEYQIGLAYTVDQPFLGVELATSLQLGYRTYPEFSTTLDGRDDQFVTAVASGTFQDVSYFGFSPRVSLSATRTESTAEEFTSSALQLLIGVDSNF